MLSLQFCQQVEELEQYMTEQEREVQDTAEALSAWQTKLYSTIDMAMQEKDNVQLKSR